MSDPRAFEVVPQAIVKEIPVDPSLTIQSQNLRKEVVKSIDKGNWRKGLDQVRETQEIKYEGFAKQTSTFGVEIEDNPRSPDYGKVRRTSEEGTYIKKIQDFQELATRFFDKGYDKLANGEKDELRRHVLTQARRIPLLAPQIDRLVAAGQGDAFAERYIKDPSFTAELKNIINNTLDENFDNEVLEKFEAFTESRNAFDISKEELDEIELKISALKARLNSFARTNTGTYAPGATNAELIDQLRVKKPIHIAEIPDYERRVTEGEAKLRKLEQSRELSLMNPQSFMGTEVLASINADIIEKGKQKDTAENTLSTEGAQGAEKQAALRKIGRLEGEIDTLTSQRARMGTQALPARALIGEGGIDNDIEAVTTELNDARRELSLRKGEIEQLTQLEAEQERLESSVTTLQESRRKILEDHQKNDVLKQRSQREYDTAKEKRLLDEKVYTEKIESSWGRASNEIIAQQLEQANQVFNEELEDMKKVSADAHERALYVTMQNTWLGPERRRTKGFPGHKSVDVYRPLDKASILQDYATLLREGDVQLTRCLFERTTNPDTNLPFTEDEINDIFEKNPDLVKKAQPEAVKQLLARKISVGGMTHEDAYIVATSPWGKDMIQNAIDQNTHFRSEISRLMGADALLSHGFKEKFGQEMAKHPFWWAILLGIPAGIKALQMDPTLENINNQR